MNILNKIQSPPIEYTVRLNSMWKKKLFVSICRKHEIRTYRYLTAPTTKAVGFPAVSHKTKIHLNNAQSIQTIYGFGFMARI